MNAPYETLDLRPQTTRNDAVGDAGENEFAAVQIGGEIDGYEVVSPLAEGGMGAVFRVRDRVRDAELALKAPLPGGRGGSFTHRLRRFLREARLTARMDHEGVAKVREQGHCAGLPYFTLDLVDGVALSERIYDEGVLPILEAVKIGESSARAAHHIHQKGVVHRDLKPANVLIKKDGSAVIIDFGLARDAQGIDPRITASGIWLGTPAYICPEQASGDASRVDARADVYSLGAILYEMLTGLPPHGVGRTKTIFKALREKDARPPSALRPEVPAALDRIVMRALAREKEDRYPNAESMANALNALAEELAMAELDNSQVSEDLEGSSHGSRIEAVVTGWNETTEAKVADAPRPTLAKRASPLATPALVVEEPKASKTSGRKSSGTRAKPTSATAPATKRSSGNRRRPVKRSDGMETLTRYLAFGGPAVAGLLGLLLLI